MKTSRRASDLSWLIALLGLATGWGCEGASHENIDRWMRTEKGPSKLRDAMADSGVDVDLRAHAAENLIKIDRSSEVLEVLEEADEPERVALLTALVPRLWDNARVTEEFHLPSAKQAQAKDALYSLRKFADDEVRTTIDDFLIEWYTGGFYEARRGGSVSAAMVMRAVGPRAGPKLVEVARSILVRPAQEGARLKIGDALLLGLAYCGDEEALKFLLSLLERTKKGDASLPERAMAALHRAYVGAAPEELGNGQALVAIRKELVELATDEGLRGTTINDAVDLIAAMGMPECLPPLIDLVAFPHTKQAFLWMGVQKALRCGKADAIVPVAEALPRTGSYERGILKRYMWDEITRLPTKNKAASAARTLLDSQSWVAQATGIELLGELAAAPERDAALLRQLAGSEATLLGWEKGNSGATVGSLAKSVAKQLETVARNP